MAFNLDFEKVAKRKTRRRIPAVGNDGGEYLSDYMKEHFRIREIDKSLATAYSLHQNWVAGHMERTLVDLERLMIRRIPLQNVYGQKNFHFHVGKK